MLVGAVAGVLVGVALMFFIFGQVIESRVNDRIDQVNKDFETDLNNFRNDVKKELDARLPPTGTGAVVPTPTPAPSVPPEGEGAITPTPTPSAAPTETATVSPTETATPTPTIAP